MNFARLTPILLVFACSPDPRPIRAPAKAETVTVSVGANGETIRLGDADLVVPPEALSEELAITMTKSEDAAPAEIDAVSAVFHFEPEGMSLLRPATVALTFAGGRADVQQYWSFDQGAKFLPVETRVENGRAIAEITRLGRVVVGAPPESLCGNNVIDAEELCDGAALPGDCTQAGAFTGGQLACDATCMGFDTSGCRAGKPLCNFDGALFVSLVDAPSDEHGMVPESSAWVSAGVTLRTKRSTRTESYYVQLGEVGLTVAPGAVEIDLSSLSCRPTAVELDVVDGCFPACGIARAFAGDVEVASAMPTNPYPTTLTLTAEAFDRVLFDSLEGGLNAVRVR